MNGRVVLATSVSLVVLAAGLAACNGLVGVHPLDAYEDGVGAPDGSRDSFVPSDAVASETSTSGDGGTDADADAAIVCDPSAIVLSAGACKAGTKPGWINLCEEPDAGSYVFRTNPVRPKANTSFTVHLLTDIDDPNMHLMVGNGAYCAGGTSDACEPGTCCGGKHAYVWSVGSSLGAGTKTLTAIRYASAPGVACDSSGRTGELNGSVTIDP